jgi:hypothetical protein
MSGPTGSSSRIPLPFFSALPLFLIPLCVGCSTPSAKPQPAIIWQHVGSWSGRGDLATESFPGSSGYFRFTWETSSETKPGEGRFKLILGSSISGRPMEAVVDSKGQGHGVAYTSEDPRAFYLQVESANEIWKFTVDEGFSARIEP